MKAVSGKVIREDDGVKVVLRTELGGKVQIDPDVLESLLLEIHRERSDILSEKERERVRIAKEASEKREAEARALVEARIEAAKRLEKRPIFFHTTLSGRVHVPAVCWTDHCRIRDCNWAYVDYQPFKRYPYQLKNRHCESIVSAKTPERLIQRLREEFSDEFHVDF